MLTGRRYVGGLETDGTGKMRMAAVLVYCKGHIAELARRKYGESKKHISEFPSLGAEILTLLPSFTYN